MPHDGRPLQAGDLVRIRDERWRVLRRTIHDHASVVEVIGCDTSNLNCQSRFLLPCESIERSEFHASPKLVRPRRWSRVARRALADAAPWNSLWSASRADLRVVPFQLEPALALIRGDGCRFLIADAVGLGKTVQAGLMIAETLARRSEARVLVVTPAALREQWQHELRHRFAIEADLFDAGGIARLLAHIPASVNPWAVRPIVVTSIDYVKRPEVVRSLETLTWDVVVFDEAHNLAGPSDRSRAASAIGHRARVVVLLTATPHSGDDQAFERLCSIGRFDRDDRALIFNRTRRDVGIIESRRETLLRVDLTRDESDVHDALMAYARLVWRQSSGGSGARLAMSVLVRRACSSCASLARSIERRLEFLRHEPSQSHDQPGLPFVDSCGDEEPWHCLRTPGLADVDEERSLLLQILERARRIGMSSSKFSRLRRLIERAREPVIVFTEYRDTLEELPTLLSDLETVQLHGGLTSEARREVLAQFTGGTAQVLLATDAASEGLNLHHRCRVIVNLELPWTPVRLEQRVGRVDRMGQARRVHVVHLLGRSTCEETTLARLTQRMRRAREAMASTTAVPDEQAVAEAVFEDRALAVESAVPPDVHTHTAAANLEAEGSLEAARLVTARSLVDRPHAAAGPRAMATRLPRRRGLVGSHGLWLFRITVSSASGRVVWEPFVALKADLANECPGGVDIRSRLATDQPRLQSTLSRAGEELLHSLQQMLQRPLTLSRCREEHLVAHLRSRQARLASDLLQRSLFDSRVERSVASQAAVLRDALSSSQRRLQELESLHALQIEGYRLTVSAVID